MTPAASAALAAPGAPAPVDGLKAIINQVTDHERRLALLEKREKSVPDFSVH